MIQDVWAAHRPPTILHLTQVSRIRFWSRICLRFFMQMFMFMFDSRFMIYECLCIHIPLFWSLLVYVSFVYKDLFVCMYVCIYLSSYLSICLSVCLSVCPSVCLSVYLSIYVSMYLIQISIDLSIHIYMHLLIYNLCMYYYVCMFNVCLFLCLCCVLVFEPHVSPSNTQTVFERSLDTYRDNRGMSFKGNTSKWCRVPAMLFCFLAGRDIFKQFRIKSQKHQKHVWLLLRPFSGSIIDRVTTHDLLAQMSSMLFLKKF